MKRLFYLVLILVSFSSACDEESPQCTACWDSYTEFYDDGAFDEDDNSVNRYCEDGYGTTSCRIACESGYDSGSFSAWFKFDDYLSDTCDKVCAKD